MHLANLLVYFETSPALSLLRSSNAPFIVDFLNRQFKQSGRISVPHAELLDALRAYQEGLNESDPGKLPMRSDEYLSQWCSQETRWLRRFLESGCEEPVYQLTPHTEDVISFLDQALGKDLGFVGTESRLKLVIDTLADLCVGASADPQKRLEHLRQEQNRIQSEITRIETDGIVSTYRPAQVRERFMTAVSLLKQLQGDFRELEESFRQLTAQVQRHQVEGKKTRGGILEFALDAEDLLRQEDQGVSFYAFVHLILTPSETERLEQIIQEVRRMTELALMQEGLDVIRGMISLLQSEAEKVIRTNQRLSTTLRRLLDARGHAERQRIAQLLQEIRSLAVSVASHPPRHSVGLDLEVDLALESPFRRTFWSAPVQLEVVDLVNFQADDQQRRAIFGDFAALKALDWKSMRHRIREMLDLRPDPTLGELLQEYPLKAGVVEVLGYLQLAQDEGHLIHSELQEEVIVPPIPPSARKLRLIVPLITFLPKDRNGHAK